MTPSLWIGLAYSVVAIVLLLYVARLRRQIRALAASAPRSSRTPPQPAKVG